MKNRILNLFKGAYKDSLIKNAIYLIASSLSSLAFGFVFWMVAARYYTPYDVGMISAILSSVFLISMISLIGLPMSLALYLPMYKKDAKKIINSSLIMGIGISIFFSLIYVAGIEILAPKLTLVLRDTKMVVIFIITTVMMTVSSLMSAIYTAGKKSSFHMIKENIFGILRIFLIVLLSGFGAIGMFISWSIGLAITVAIGLFLLYKLWKYIPTLTLEIDPIIKKMASFSGGNYISGILYNIPRFVFPIMIAGALSPEYAGYFFIAMTIAGVFYGVPEAIAGPFLAESTDKNKFWHNVNNAIKFIIAILVPGLIVLMISGKYILNMFSPNYADNSFGTVVILSVASIPLSLIIVFNTIKNAQKNVKWSIISNGIITTITIILAIPFMEMWSIEGVALAYLTANVIMASVIVFMVKNPMGFLSRLLKGEDGRDSKHIRGYIRKDISYWQSGDREKDKKRKSDKEDHDDNDKNSDKNIVSV